MEHISVTFLRRTDGVLHKTTSQWLCLGSLAFGVSQCHHQLPQACCVLATNKRDIVLERIMQRTYLNNKLQLPGSDMGDVWSIVY